MRLANQADSPEFREKLLNLAREWMHAVMDVEDAASATEDQWPKAPKQRSSGRLARVRARIPEFGERPATVGPGAITGFPAPPAEQGPGTARVESL